MTSLIVIDEVIKKKSLYNIDKLKENDLNFIDTKNKKENEEINELNFFQHFQKINFDEIDFEKYIQKTEETLQTFNYDKICNKFLGPQFEKILSFNE